MLRDSVEEAKASLKPCVVCGELTDVHPICERWQLCLRHVAEWFEDPRFGSNFEANIAATPGWIAEKRRERSAA